MAKVYEKAKAQVGCFEVIKDLCLVLTAYYFYSLELNNNFAKTN